MKPLPYKDATGRIVLPSPGAWSAHTPETWPFDPVPQEELDAIGYVPEGEDTPTDEQLIIPENVMDDFGVEELEGDEDD